MSIFSHSLFFIILCSVFFSTFSQDTPSPRYEQTSALVGANLYFFGGAFSSTNTSNEIWYLDLSSPFNKTTPPWNKDIDIPVKYKLGTSCVNPVDNSTVFLIGGIKFIPNTITEDNDNYLSNVYKFNSNISEWMSSNDTTNNYFTKRNRVQAVINNDGEIFIFGGTNFTGNPLNVKGFSDMNILSTINMTWSTRDYSQKIPQYIDYTATLLPNGLIVYIGGRQILEQNSSTSVNLINMSQVRLNIVSHLYFPNILNFNFYL